MRTQLQVDLGERKSHLIFYSSGCSFSIYFFVSVYLLKSLEFFLFGTIHDSVATPSHCANLSQLSLPSFKHGTLPFGYFTKTSNAHNNFIGISNSAYWQKRFPHPATPLQLQLAISSRASSKWPHKPETSELFSILLFPYSPCPVHTSIQHYLVLSPFKTSTIYFEKKNLLKCVHLCGAVENDPYTCLVATTLWFIVMSSTSAPLPVPPLRDC